MTKEGIEPKRTWITAYLEALKKTLFFIVSIFFKTPKKKIWGRTDFF